MSKTLFNKECRWILLLKRFLLVLYKICQDRNRPHKVLAIYRVRNNTSVCLLKNDLPVWKKLKKALTPLCIRLSNGDDVLRNQMEHEIAPYFVCPRFNFPQKSVKETFRVVIHALYSVLRLPSYLMDIQAFLMAAAYNVLQI
jgi:hypothetical protein